jgi:hypothetical protein
VCLCVSAHMHVCIFMCVCACLFVCMSVFVYVCMCVFLCVCIWVCIYVHAYMYMYMHVYVYVFVCVCMCECMYICMYVYVCACVCVWLCVCGCVCVVVCVCFFKKRKKKCVGGEGMYQVAQLVGGLRVDIDELRLAHLKQKAAQVHDALAKVGLGEEQARLELIPHALERATLRILHDAKNIHILTGNALGFGRAFLRDYRGSCPNLWGQISQITFRQMRNIFCVK